MKILCGLLALLALLVGLVYGSVFLFFELLAL